MADLFAPGSSASEQLSLFGVGERLPPRPVQNVTPDPAKVRRRLLAVLETARAARSPPWNDRETRMWRIVFPNMAKWLPELEAEELRAAFAGEMERLAGGGADQRTSLAAE